MTDTASMVEKVARALHVAASDTSWPPEDDRHLQAWNDMSEAWREDYRTEARAAIEAMREPTEAMIRAGRGEDDDPHDRRDCESAWPDMIDAALSDAAR